MKTKLTIAIACVLAATISPLSASTFVVNSLADDGPGTLRQRIIEANNAPGDDTITFSVTGTITLGANLPAITDNLSIVGSGTNSLTINGAGAYRVLMMTGGHTNSLYDLTISNSFAHGTDIPGKYFPAYTTASGITSDGSLTMLRCVLTTCRVYYSRGGGIYNAGTLDMQACVITNSGCIGNLPPMSDGGGVYQTNAVLQMRDCAILNCSSAQQSDGGGIASVGSNSLLKLTNTRIEACTGNTQGDGGGLSFAGTLILNDCVISKCSGFWGGGIVGGGSLFATNTTITGNGATFGGGMWIGGTAVFSGCTVSSNACAGGAAGIQNLANLTMYNCTISRNWTWQGQDPVIAGAISDNYSGARGITYLDHCTVVSNDSPRDLGILGNFTSQNSILGNVTGTINSLGHNLIVNTSGATITNDVTGNIYNVNPLLGPLQNNGGPTWTHALLPGSPAIDAAGTSGLTADQRGAVRPALADIGAYEVVSVTPPNLQISAPDSAHVLLSWLSAPGPVVLQQKSDLNNGNWSDVSASAVNNNSTTSSILLSTDLNGKFYRLRSP